MWNPDGTKLAIALIDGTCQLWEVASPQQPFTQWQDDGLDDGRCELRLCWSTDGTKLAVWAVHSEKRDKTCHIWDVAAKMPEARLQHEDDEIIEFVCWNQSSSKLATISSKTCIVWDAGSQEKESWFECSIPLDAVSQTLNRTQALFCWNPEGTMLAKASQDMRQVFFPFPECRPTFSTKYAEPDAAFLHRIAFRGALTITGYGLLCWCHFLEREPFRLVHSIKNKRLLQKIVEGIPKDYESKPGEELILKRDSMGICPLDLAIQAKRRSMDCILFDHPLAQLVPNYF